MPSADAQKGQLQNVLENKGIKFQIKSGTAKYDCHLLDRSTHERMKATRTNSTDTQSSTSSASTVSSSH
ncbi:hypothetical protein CGCA056_v008453 [Colletotrichum aenigma]|uniref:uncharacterized protein n=1 Tax=Colletotrichum aenigma TaxID=1215731 RepID=UPI00187282D4|nr:uncharacterized protein CGCA056_v008453 [Colletotrichum aenigma]KAF5520599.1 hypothetical protein CGCA056_v008453 [Colletotrichum aenigma]